MEPQTLITIILSVFGALGFKEIIIGSFNWVIGRQDRNKKQLEAIATRAKDAEEESRVYREYALRLRTYILSVHHEDPDEVLPWPSVIKSVTNTE